MEKVEGEEKQKLGWGGPQVMSKMEPVTQGAYGGGMCGTEKEPQEKQKLGGGGPQVMSKMEPVTQGAYGGGMYGTEKEPQEKQTKAPASESQSADGPVDKDAIKFKHSPPSSGDRDIDITGQSYIQ